MMVHMVILWAFSGIVVRQIGIPLIWIAAAVGMLVILVALALKRLRIASRPAHAA